MPEYHLDVHDDYGTWKRLDAFTQGYIEAMFFTENSPAYSYADIEERPDEWRKALEEGQSDGQIPGDATFSELDGDSLAKIKAQCVAFQEANRQLIDVAIEHGGRKGDYDDAAAGRDFWYTRNGHGVGFWDRGLGDIGDKLSDAARPYGQSDVYLGDDGKVHVS